MALTKLKLFSDGLLIFGCFLYAPSRYSILGLGYLGLPLAQKFYEQGSQVAAIKRNLTSDDINLPIELDIIDLNQDDIFTVRPCGKTISTSRYGSACFRLRH